MGDALVDSPLAVFRLGEQGQLLINAGQALNVQGQLGQHIGGVGLAVQGIVQPYGLGVGGSDLLGIAQQCSQLDIAEVVAVRAVDGEFLCIGGLLFGHRCALLTNQIKITNAQMEYSTVRAKMQSGVPAQ